jgi:hypothetical protein
MTTRRSFIKSAGLAAAAVTIVPRHVLGNGYIAPSDTLYIAGIGVGGKGTSDLTGFAGSIDGKAKGHPKAKVAYLCDVDDRRAATSVKNFPTAKYFKDYRKMLETDHIST